MAVAIVALIGCAALPTPRCNWSKRGCDCWYACDANWHVPLAEIPRNYGAIAHEGRIFHWRGCEVKP
jgi:hypothetical protein